MSVSKAGIVIAKWYDNEAILTGSKFVGPGNTDVCRKWDKFTRLHSHSKKEVIIMCNSSMGGVDKSLSIIWAIKKIHCQNHYACNRFRSGKFVARRQKDKSYNEDFKKRHS